MTRGETPGHPVATFGHIPSTNREHLRNQQNNGILVSDPFRGIVAGRERCLSRIPPIGRLTVIFVLTALSCDPVSELPTTGRTRGTTETSESRSMCVDDAEAGAVVEMGASSPRGGACAAARPPQGDVVVVADLG